MNMRRFVCGFFKENVLFQLLKGGVKFLKYVDRKTCYLKKSSEKRRASQKPNLIERGNIFSFGFKFLFLILR